MARLGIQSAEALDYAHQMGIVHRDVKPANLLVDAEGRLWVTDFGLAQIQSDARLTMTGDLVGTLRYMSPEQALAKRVVVDHRTDVYSLGATLYELLTLEAAYSGNDRQELLRQISFEEPRPPRRWNRAIPQELETIVVKAMERNPADRYASAQELADDLRRFLDDRPIMARLPSWRQVAQKWARRHRAAVTAATACLLVSLAALAGSVGWGVRNAEVRRAETAAREAEIERAAVADLEEAERHLKGERWPEVAQALQRAEGRLATGGPAHLHERVEQMKQVVAMVDRLDKARLLASSHPAIEANLPGGDRAYAAAFVAYGLDPQALSPGEAARRIRDSAICEQLVTALDEWSFIKERLREGSGKPLQAVARLADDDRRRQRLRDLLAQQDMDALERFAKEKETLDLPPLYLIMLGQTLADRGRGSGDLWRRAAGRYPRNFWINSLLGASMLVGAQGNQAALMETAGFLRVALAVRPQAPHTQLMLAQCLAAAGRWSEAEQAYRKVIELDPDVPLAHNRLGAVLTHQGQLAEAVVAFRKAIELKPDYAEAHYNLGNALHDQKKWLEAVAVYQQAFAIEPRLTGEQPSAHRYNAACAAALAGCGQGKDADHLDAQESAPAPTGTGLVAGQPDRVAEQSGEG